MARIKLFTEWYPVAVLAQRRRLTTDVYDDDDDEDVPSEGLR